MASKQLDSMQTREDRALDTPRRSDQAKACFRDGVLEITVPAQAMTKARRLSIDGVRNAADESRR